MSFQLKDDLLDLYGNEGVFGKMTGGDVLANKKTYLVLRAIELASEADQKRLFELFDRDYLIDSEAKISEVKAIFDKYNIQQEVNAIMSQYLESAFSSLDKVNIDSSRKDFIRNYAKYLYDRIS